MKNAKTYIIEKYYARGGRTYHVKGTLPQLIDYFGYTLECGNSWNPKITLQPKTAKSLISALNKSVTETQGGCYNQDSYELVETVTEDERFTDLTKNN